MSPNMPFWFGNPRNDTYTPFCTFEPGRHPQPFTPDECERIIDLVGPEASWAKGTISAENFVDPRIRDVAKLSVGWQPERHWLFERLTEMICGANESWWRFDITGIGEELELLRYERSGHYNVHLDFDRPHNANRKISLSVQLSDPCGYVGGDLELGVGDDVHIASRSQGSVTLFPSFLPHRVSPVTEGVRFSLIGWVHGPPFR